jgi:hypothetical protein
MSVMHTIPLHPAIFDAVKDGAQTIYRPNGDGFAIGDVLQLERSDRSASPVDWRKELLVRVITSVSASGDGSAVLGIERRA